MATTEEQVSRTPRVLLCVTGCIAAYKACEVLRGLQRAGCDVRVAMTEDACHFVGATTFEALSTHPVALDLSTYPDSSIPHIFLSGWADVALVCPCTANVLAKVAAGIADDCVTSTLLACDIPVLIAPAMNNRMWANQATQANLATLINRGIEVISPDTGLLACGDTGTGKLADVSDIVNQTLFRISRLQPSLLSNKRVLITAGPTHEAIDPVRYIANRSSGKMGYALAEAARDAGADVVLISGPTALTAPYGVEVVYVESAAQMYEAACKAFEQADIAILSAAVADYTPQHPADHKLKKQHEQDRSLLSTLALKETDDILAELSRQKGSRVVIGFATETTDLLTHAQEKLMRKGCDLIVANDVSRQDSTFGSDTNRITILSPEGEEQLPTMSKAQVAKELIIRAAELLKENDSGCQGEVS